ncbi:hypothetical protein FRC05_002844 [Tulasnella sp. 425]|nr:hypothetical protein FRC05_002844 [Tulasnella sp. 425]
MLKPKKSKKSRPHTPPSPSSFVSPRSPSWHEQAFSQHTKARQPSGSRRRSRSRDNIASKGDDDQAPAVIIETAGPSNASTTHLSPLPPNSSDSRPLSSGSDDLLSQISSYAFPLPPSDNKRELLSANGNQPLRVRFLNQDKPQPNFKVALSLTEEQTLEDMMLATGLLTGPRGERRRGNKEKESEPASATSSTGSRDLPLLPRLRSASIPNEPGPSKDIRSGSVGNVPTFRRNNIPKPIRTNTTPAFLPKISVEGGPEPVAPVASTSSSTHASPSDGSLLKSSPGETVLSSKADSASGLAPTPERKGSSSATTPEDDAETPAESTASSKKAHSRNSKPQPPLPDTSPYQSPTFASPYAPMVFEAPAEQPSRPPRQPKPQVTPSVIIPAAPSIARMVANALHRQSAMSTATSFLPSSGGVTPAYMNVPLPSATEALPTLQPSEESAESSEGRHSNVTELPFSPNFLMPFASREGQSRVDSTMMLADSARVDSATLPMEFPIHSPPSASNQLGVGRGSQVRSSTSPMSRTPVSAASAPGDLSSSRRSPQPATSPAPIPRPPLSSQLPGVIINRTSKAERRSVSASNVQALVMQANRLAAGHFALAESIAEAVPHTPMEDVNMSEENASGEGEIMMFLDVRENSSKGKGKATAIEEEEEPVSPAPPQSEFQPPQQASGSASVSRNGSRSGSARSPPQIVIPVLYNSSSAATPSPRTPHTGSSIATAASGRHDPTMPSLPVNRPRQGSEDSLASERSARSDKGREKEGSTSTKSPRGGLPGQSTLSIVREDAVVPPSAPPAEAGPSTAKAVSHSPSLPSLKKAAATSSHHLRNSPSLPNGSSVFPAQAQSTKKDTLEAANAALRNSFSRPPRPAPVPNINVAPATSVTTPLPSGNAGSSASQGVAPLKLTKTPPSAIPPTTSAYLKRRERSASDSVPLSPRHNLQRSSSVSEVHSPLSTAGSPQGSQAPSSFGAAFSRAFVSLKRKKSDQSMKGKDSDREDQDKRNKGVPPPIISVAPSPGTQADTRRNTASQFPQTPRPFSITSSGDHHVMTTMAAKQTLTIPPAVKLSEAGAPKLSPVQPTPVPTSAASTKRPPSAFKAQTEKAGTPSIRWDPNTAAGPSSATTTGGSPLKSAKSATAPRFESVPIPWKGLTLDAAKWTFTSNQLQEIVGRAIRQSAEASSIRLLAPEILDHQLPNETYRLELLREDIKARYKFHVRRRRVLLRSLNLYVDGSDPETAKRLADELAESSVACDRLTEELFQVTDQLAQMNQVTQRHNSSALSMALRKLNTSYIKARGETIDAQLNLAMMEAERDEGWAVAESVERELNHYKQKYGVADDFLASPLPSHAPPSSWTSRSPGSSRVSAARKTSVRASKASLRMSKRSARSSASSGVRFGPIIPPSSSSSGSASGGSRATSRVLDDGSSAKSPSVPPVPSLKASRRTSDRSFSSYSHSHNSHSRRASIAGTPSTASRAMAQAQTELFEMLGIPHEDIERQGDARRRSYSAPSSPTSTELQRTRRISLPSTSSLLESPSVIAAMLSLPSANL